MEIYKFLDEEIKVIVLWKLNVLQEFTGNQVQKTIHEQNEHVNKEIEVK